MGEQREDLLALDDDALVTLANRGLLNRAKKVLSRGDGPTLQEEADGTLVALAGEVLTRLPPGTALAETSCSCGSSGVCRHRLAAVLAYQAQFGRDAPSTAPRVWSPAMFAGVQLEHALGARVMTRAKALRNKGVVAEVRRVSGSQLIPAVHLSTSAVQFLVPEDLAYARCDCQLSHNCEHVALAVWAWVEAERSAPEAPVAVVEVGRVELSKAALEPADASLELAASVLLDGAVHVDEGLLSRFAVARRRLEDAGFQWQLETLEALEESLRRYRSRSAIYQQRTPGALVTEIHARARAALGGGAHPARAILGQDVAPQTRLDHLRLTSLGARVSGDGEDRRVDVYFASPDDRVVLAFRRNFKAQGPAFSLATRTALPGIPLGALARGHVVTAAARRHANRRIHFGRSVVAKTSVTPQKGEWDSLPEPVLARDFARLRDHLRAGVPQMLGPRYLANRVHALAVEHVGEVVYRRADQRLECDLFDPQGSKIRLRLEHRSAAPEALDVLADALRGPVRFVSGEVEVVGTQLIIEPLALVTDRLIVPDLARSRGDGIGTAPSRADAATDPLRNPLDEALEVLDRGVHLGILRAPPSWANAVARSSATLEAVGLRTTASRMKALHATIGRLAVTGAPGAREAAVQRWLDVSIRVRLASERA